MADSANTVGSTSLNALIKDVLHDTVVNTVPTELKLQRLFPFEQGKEVGRKYLMPVVLSGEHGITYSKPDNGAFTLEDSVNAIAQEAQIEPYQIVNKATISYELAFRTEGGGKKARVDAVQQVMQNVNESLRKRVEIDLAWGQTGLGATAASTASTSVVINDETWAAGIWGGMKGAKVAILDSGLAAAEDTDETISSIDLNSKTIVLGNAQTLDAGDLVYFKGAVEAGGTPVHHSMPGLDKIATNTGTLFNISASTYADGWKATTVSSVGALTMAKVLNAASYAVNRGCMEDLTFFCSPKAYETLASTLADLRRLDTSYRHSKGESGFESLVFYGQNGKLEVVPHIFWRDGQALLVPTKRVKRIGATDVTFKRPGAEGGAEMVKESAGVAGFELRAYTSQAIFCEKPSWIVKLSGITYS